MAYLTLSNISKQFTNTTVVQDFNLDVEKGEFVSFLGPSGCGKTTTLRMIAGFEVPSTGNVTLDDEDITNKAPNQRNVGMVFQAYALFPNMTVAQNIGFGLRIRREKPEAIQEVITEMLALIHLEQKGNSYPHQLSGGQQQRVAIARALVNDPAIILADEPTGNLDTKSGQEIMELLLNLNHDHGTTLIIVTHAADIAAHAQRIIRIRDGVVEETV